MTMTLNQRSLDNLTGVHPDLVRVVHRAAKAEPFIVTEGLRNMKRQKELKAAGKSWTLNSRHLTGHAVDVVDPDGKYDIPDMNHIAKAFKEAAEAEGVPIDWGGDWKSRDTPHFELRWSAYPSSGVGVVTKAKEVAAKVVTSKTVVAVTGTAAGTAVSSTPVPAPSLPSPPDLSWFSGWKGFGETLMSLGTFAWQNVALTALLAVIVAALWFLPKPEKAS
jgi:peptidoglycan L-alanyl-D-glutamate endopeptidase CwlK